VRFPGVVQVTGKDNGTRGRWRDRRREDGQQRGRLVADQLAVLVERLEVPHYPILLPRRAIQTVHGGKRHRR
jgi:hypothetical protein